MTLKVATVTVDADDRVALAAFWAGVLNGEAHPPDKDGDILVTVPGSDVELIFLEVHDAKTVKNRVHLDLRPGPGEQEAEIARVLALGARHVDVGQTGEETFVVLADPEGNEFCILRPVAS